MKVLQITASASYGGGPEHLRLLAEGLVEKGISVSVACPKQKPYWDRYSSITHGNIVEIPERKLTVLGLLSLIRLVRTESIDLIHSHGKGAGVYGRILSILTAVPLVHTPHGIHIDHYSRLMASLYRAYEWVTARVAKVNIFVSPSELSKAESLGFPMKRVEVVFNGVHEFPKEEVSRWRGQIRASLSLDENEFVIVGLSRFDYAKNMYEMAEVAASVPDARFLFVGDGADKAGVESYCRSLGVKNVTFTGFVDTPRMYLAAADLYLSTSRWEGLPMAVIEAMSMGIPAVATNVVGNRDAVQDEKTGLLYELGNVEQAARKISSLMNDKYLVKSMVRNCTSRQEEFFSVATMVKRTLEIYRDILGMDFSDSSKADQKDKR